MYLVKIKHFSAYLVFQEKYFAADLCFFPLTPAMISLSLWFIFVPLPPNDPPNAVAAKIYREQKKNKSIARIAFSIVNNSKQCKLIIN